MTTARAARPARAHRRRTHHERREHRRPDRGHHDGIALGHREPAGGARRDRRHRAAGHHETLAALANEDVQVLVFTGAGTRRSWRARTSTSSTVRTPKDG
ncbi:hypothetical protein QJS66_19220 [Kocuria rhizophila]|nr:hypothetical protein QJS66_19220 [Kocuria rhizophila]